MIDSCAMALSQVNEALPLFLFECQCAWAFSFPPTALSSLQWASFKNVL